MDQRMLVIDPNTDFEKIKGLASKIRLQILALINDTPRNVNDIAEALSLPQSTVATNLMVLEQAGLVTTEKTKGRKGTQKISSALYSEIVIEFQGTRREIKNDGVIEVEMPIGLYNRFEVTAPCGLCSPEGIIGYLDVPDHFLDPNRIKAGLIWFEKGFVEYKFPNNGLYNEAPISALELATELSSEVPGTNKEWRSDITLWINDVRVGTWTSPGDYGDKRGKYTPHWWKLEGSQYGLLKHWRVTEKGSFIDGVKISSVTLTDLNLNDHHSISVTLGVEEDANRIGGINIFGRNFGNYDQDLILRLFFK